MSRHCHSAPFSRRTTKSLRNRDWTQTMTKSTCAFCSGWATRNYLANRYMRALTRFWKNLGYDLNSPQEKMGFWTSRGISVAMMILNPRQACYPMGVVRAALPQDELPSTPCMTPRTRSRKQIDPVFIHDPLPHSDSIAKGYRLEREQRPELARGRRRKHMSDGLCHNLLPYRLGGVG